MQALSAATKGSLQPGSGVFDSEAVEPGLADFKEGFDDSLFTELTKGIGSFSGVLLREVENFEAVVHGQERRTFQCLRDT